jgi:opacity protein-like surface antigen
VCVIYGKGGWAMVRGLAGSWSAKVEYDYANFGTTNFTSTNTAVPSGTITTLGRSATSSLNVFKAGIEYCFHRGGSM